MLDGHLLAAGPCWACHRIFTFDPDLVPSVPIDPVTNLAPDLGGDGSRAVYQPLCEECVALANQERRAKGREDIEVPLGGLLVSEAARVIIEVLAGVLPEQPEPDFTRRYGITSTEWEQAADQSILLAERCGQAVGYAQALMAMPQRLNWVRVDWLWL